MSILGQHKKEVIITESILRIDTEVNKMLKDGNWKVKYTTMTGTGGGAWVSVVLERI